MGIFSVPARTECRHSNVILAQGVLLGLGEEERLRKKLILESHIDSVIGLPANLFFLTDIPVCIMVLKKCKKPDDILFINGSGERNFHKGKRSRKQIGLLDASAEN
jgi:type I restriction enzyme M protein